MHHLAREVCSWRRLLSGGASSFPTYFTRLQAARLLLDTPGTPVKAAQSLRLPWPTPGQHLYTFPAAALCDSIAAEALKTLAAARAGEAGASAAGVAGAVAEACEEMLREDVAANKVGDAPLTPRPWQRSLAGLRTGGLVSRAREPMRGKAVGRV